MALPSSSTGSWLQNLDTPSRFFGFDRTDFELYEEDDTFVLTIELPGFDREEIDVNWFEGRLAIAAEHEDEARGRRRTYHRSFRMPKEIEPDDIAARYENGVLEVHLPILQGAMPRGQPIEVEG